MTDEQLAEFATKRLLGTMKKYTHTIVMRRTDLKPIVIETDVGLETHNAYGVQAVLSVGSYSSCVFAARVEDVLYHHTIANPTD